MCTCLKESDKLRQEPEISHYIFAEKQYISSKDKENKLLKELVYLFVRVSIFKNWSEWYKEMKRQPETNVERYYKLEIKEARWYSVQSFDSAYYRKRGDSIICVARARCLSYSQTMWRWHRHRHRHRHRHTNRHSHCHSHRHRHTRRHWDTHIHTQTHTHIHLHTHSSQ